MAIPSIEAVECAQCHALHKASSMGYMMIFGKLLRRRGSRGVVQERTKHLGTEENPTILCDSLSCLTGFLMPDNDY